MTERQQAIVQLQAKCSAETDAAKRRDMLLELGKLAKEEIAARKALEDGPTYPRGLEASFGNKSAKVLDVRRAGTGWEYDLEIDTGILLLDAVRHTTDEATVRETLAKELGQAVGPAFPRGIALKRNGLRCTVEEVLRQGDGWAYKLHGCDKPMTERELSALLASA